MYDKSKKAVKSAGISQSRSLFSQQSILKGIVLDAFVHLPLQP